MPGSTTPGPRYSSDADAGERIVLPYLRHRGITRLDGLIVSHLDGDHSGGTAALLRAPAGAARDQLDRAVARDVPRPPHRALRSGTALVRRGDGVHRAPSAGRGLRASSHHQRDELRRAGGGRIAPRAAHRRHRHRRRGGDPGALARIGARTGWQRRITAAARRRARRCWPRSARATPSRRRGTAIATATRMRAWRRVMAEAGIALRRTDHAGALQWRMKPDGDTRHSAWRTEGVRYWHNRPGRRRGNLARGRGGRPNRFRSSPSSPADDGLWWSACC